MQCPYCKQYAPDGPHRCGWDFVSGLELLIMGERAVKRMIESAKKRNALETDPIADGVWIKRADQPHVNT